MPGGEIQRDTYINADGRTRSAMTFDMLQSIRVTLRKETRTNDTRITKLEKKKLKTTAYASLLGILGGYLASAFHCN